MGRKNWLFSKNGKGARANVIYQSLIMNAEVNSLRPWKYLERLLAELKELEEPIEEGGAIYLGQRKCKKNVTLALSVLKKSTLLQKSSLNASHLKKVIAFRLFGVYIILCIITE